MNSAQPPIGLIAGAGRFPITFARKAREQGLSVVCVGIAGMADAGLSEECDRFHWLNSMSLGFILRTFRSTGVKQWTMAGKFHKSLLFQSGRLWRLIPDWRAIRLFFFRNRHDKRDDALLLALIREFEDQGFVCMSALELCPELLVKKTQLTRRSPTTREMQDIVFGWSIAKEIGRLDIGQSVMIREGAILAVEAIEGTDQAIARAGELCRHSHFVVVKVAKPQQDMRFDVPTIGLNTIETMYRSGARVLAIEANKTIVLDQEDTVKLAEQYGICIVSLDNCQQTQSDDSESVSNQ